MNVIVELFQKHPELAVFFCLAAGYWVGSVKLGRFSLGTVVGTLLVALIVGQMHIVVPDFIKTLFFSLFMFAVGYHVGPQFFSGLRRGGLQMVVLSVIFCLVGLGIVLLTAKLFGLDKGFAAGLLSGGLTQSSVIGSATDAIGRLPLPENVRQELAHHVPLGDAVTYIFGVIAPSVFLSKFAPKLIRADLKVECEKMEDELSGGPGRKLSGAFDSYVPVDLQAFRIDHEGLVGKGIGYLERILPDRCYVQRIRHGRKVLKPQDEVTLQRGDVIVVSGNREDLIKVQSLIGGPIADPEAMDMPFETVPVIVTQKAAIGKTLGEIREAAPARAKGIHLRRITRQGQTLPRLLNTRVARGDVLELVGQPADIERAARFLGFPDRPSEKSDFVFISLACVVGVLLGVFSIKIGAIAVSLGSSGGILVGGLFFGWFHSLFPRFGRVPSAAVWLMETLGLNVFIAAVGLAAGPHAVAAMKSDGLQLLAAGVAVTLIPHVVTLLVGRYGFKLNAGVLLGACAGAGTATPAMQAINEESQSAVPTLGFTIPYALSNVLLTAWGPVVVALVTG
ncbi:MAG TPA: aspartate-alanine antiporter [Verrucomicrobiae bacterium]|jgi:putative transport protein|nr:aspartate-alanine antiporter [Verrucomicrobiae bacterium]